jgi:hypothetical protein
VKKPAVQGQWYRAWWVDAAYATIGLLLAYSAFITAVDSGSLVQYSAAIVFVVLAVVLFYRSFKKLHDLR